MSKYLSECTTMSRHSDFSSAFQDLENDFKTTL